MPEGFVGKYGPYGWKPGEKAFNDFLMTAWIPMPPFLRFAKAGGMFKIGTRRAPSVAPLAGSGPVPGVLEASSRVKSFAALRNYNTKGIEYVFDPTTSTFAVGRPAASAGLKGSPHQQLAQSIGANPSTVVGGTVS